LPTSVGGAQRTTCAPILERSQMLERATRLCRMSPTMATRRPLSLFFLCRRVRASSRAWVGCSWAPSPAFTIAERQWRARKCGAPEAEWRTTIMSGFMASRFFAVSSSVSPLDTLEPAVVMVRLSAERTFSATSNEARVRVEDS